jgi:hypothetical protein
MNIKNPALHSLGKAMPPLNLSIFGIDLDRRIRHFLWLFVWVGAYEVLI